MERTLRVAIVEDTPEDRDQLEKYLRRYAREREARLELTAFTDGEDLVTGYTADYDLILLDIRMTFMDGMRTARQVRSVDQDVEIIFVTNMPQYAIEGYKVRASDYILKPCSWYAFCESMDRVLGRFRSQAQDSIVVAMKGGRMKLDQDRIWFVEAQDHQLIYHTRDGEYAAKGTMRDAEASLDARRFIRCNRCYLVNLKHVETCRGCDVRVGGSVIQVSRRRRKSFMDALNGYLNGEI